MNDATMKFKFLLTILHTWHTHTKPFNIYVDVDLEAFQIFNIFSCRLLIEYHHPSRTENVPFAQFAPPIFFGLTLTDNELLVIREIPFKVTLSVFLNANTL